MLRGISIVACVVLCCLTSTLFAANNTAVNTPRANASVFVANKGQWPSQVRFQCQTKEATAWICDDGLRMDYAVRFCSTPLWKFNPEGERSPIDSIHGHVVSIRFTTSNSQPTTQSTSSTIQGQNQLPGVHNYFLGNDASKWATNVPLYAEVESKNNNTAITTRYYVESNRLRYDVVLQPGADPQSISMHVDGATALRVNAQYELEMQTSIGTIVQRKLLAYQQVGSTRRVVPCAFNVRDDGTVGFKLGSYNRRRPLVIDPLLWATYIGGQSMAIGFTNNHGTEECLDVAYDAAGNAVVVGTTETNDFPTTVGAYQRTKLNVGPKISTSDIFVAKFNASGSALTFATYIGGKLQEIGRAIELDASDNIYVCGASASGDFPTTSGSYRTTMSGSGDGVICKLNPTGTTLMASTYIGGVEYDMLTGLKISGNYVYVCGNSWGGGYPVTANALQNSNNLDYASVVSVIYTSLQTLDASTYFGGIAVPNDMVIDGSGNMYVTGVAYDSLMPTTTNAYSRVRNGVFGDVFVTVINRACTTLLYGTYFGGEVEDIAYGIALDASNNILVCGRTMSPDLPTTAGAYDRTYNRLKGSARTGDPYDDIFDGFALKFNSSYQLQWSTFLGGRASDWLTHVVAGANGSLVMCGNSYSPDFPATSCCIDSTQNGASDAIVTILGPNGNAVLYSTFLGGGGTELANSIVRMSNGQLYVCGATYELSFPVTPGAYQTTRKLTDGFVLKMDPTSGFTVNAGLDRLYSCTGFGSPVYFQAVPSCGVAPYTYLWTPATGLSDPRSDRPITTTTPTGMEYTVTVTDASGAVAVNTVSLVPMLLQVTPGSDTTLCWGRNARLNTKVSGGMGPKVYSWFPARGLDDPSSPNPMANPDTNIRYILIVTDTAGCAKADTIDVRVSHAVMKGNRDTTLCGIKTVKLAPRIEGAIAPLNFKWTTVGSNVLSTSATPTFTVDSTTTFYFTVTDSLNCTGRDSITVRYSPPSALVLKGDTLVCRGSSAKVNATFTGGFAPFRYRWKLSDTSRTFDRSDSIAVATIVKNTTFSLSVVDSLGCVTQKDFVVKVDDASQPRILTEQNKKAICNGASLQLDAGTFTGASYTWSTGEKTQKIKVSKEGWYTVRVKNKTGCEGVDSVFIAVQSAPTPKMLTANDTTICEGGTATLRVPDNWKTYRWNNGAAGPVNVVANEGSYTVTVTDSLGCTGSSDTVHVHIAQMHAVLNGPNSLCAKTVGVFKVDSANNCTFQWRAVHGMNIVGGQSTSSLSGSWDGEGTDTVYVTVTDNRTNCSTIRSIIVSISSTLRPHIRASGSTVLCGSSSVNLIAPSGYDKYTWSNGETTPTITVTKPGKYSVDVVSGGCSGTSDTITVTTAPPISVSIQGDSLICRGQTAALRASGNFLQYKWSNGDSVATTQVQQAGTYRVDVLDSNGCTASSLYTVKYHSGALQSASGLNFGSQLIKKSAQLQLSLPNTSPESVLVDSVFLLSASPEFQLGSIQPSLKALVNSGSSLRVNVQFAPTLEQSYDDTLVVIVSQPCPDTLRLPLQGVGVDYKLKATISMNHVEAIFGQTGVKLPVFCTFEPTQNFSDVSATLTVRLLSSLFSVQGTSRGTIVSNTVNAGIRTVVIDLSHIDVRSGDTLCSLIGLALISNIPSTNTTPELIWTDGVVAQTVNVPGDLYIKGCAIDYQEIQLGSAFNLTLSPNPASGEVLIHVQTWIRGKHSVCIYNSIGQCIQQREFVNTVNAGMHDASFNNLESGVYTVVVQTDGGVQSIPLVVIQ